MVTVENWVKSHLTVRVQVLYCTEGNACIVKYTKCVYLHALRFATGAANYANMPTGGCLDYTLYVNVVKKL